MLCSIEGCEVEVKSVKSGLCNKHYRRYLKTGDPLLCHFERTPTEEIQQFVTNALFSDTEECILWPYSKDSDGYGWFTINGKQVAVHRYMTEKFHGKPIGDANHSCHSCDSPSCINGNHLRWDTNLENMRDKSRRYL